MSAIESEIGGTGWWPSAEVLTAFLVPGVLVLVVLYLCEHQYDDILGVPPPGPWGLPWLGYLPFLDARAPHKSLQKLAKRYGGVFQLKMGSVRTIILSDAAMVREFFRREVMTGRAPLYLTHGIMGGYGIICAQGDIWHHARREVTAWLKALGMTKRPGQLRAQLEKRISRGVDECLRLYESEAAKNCNAEVNPLGALHHSLGNIVNDLVFGITYKRDDPDWLYLQRLQEEGVKLIGVSGVVNFLPWLRHLPENERNIRFLLEGKSKTHAIYDRIVEACGRKLQEKLRLHKEQQELVRQERLKLKEMEKEQKKKLAEDQQEVREEEKDPQDLQEQKAQEEEEESEEEYEEQYQPHCILEQFLIARHPDSQLYCDDQLRHLLADLFGAGVDTSLATLRWFLLYLAKEQRCQRRLHEELLPLSGAPTLEELEPLTYLRACISETQRIRSVVPLGIPHGSKQNCTIGDHFIKKGSMIVALQWAIHMDPVAFPEPEEFRPERFLAPDGSYLAPPQFIPFSSGSRMCPGDEMARMMLTLFAGRIFRRFHLELPQGCDVDMEGESGITLTPVPHKLRFSKLPGKRIRQEPEGAAGLAK
ncbi:cytochrome P450 306a1 [Drosophila ficusphila]|uniref:cytochrome P450 306a1 n=1 Tax=Drosophila ficusphila TaxID=30025 RepID=UPI0007E7200E|nr:cytochrome P450 306a1 [Drosophila ficusphila]